MKIYVAHSSSFDYEDDIYGPLRGSDFNDHTLVLPHGGEMNFHNVRDSYKDIDMVIAECTKPSTGMGIELGWFFDDGKPIFCLYKNGTKPSSALVAITKNIIVYNDREDFVAKVKNIVNQCNLG